MILRPSLLAPALFLVAAALACDGGGPGSDAMDREIATADPASLPDRAEGLLATERPWRAARAMRRYRDAVPDAPAEHRVLAARAEAGWGGWERVAALLEHVPALDTHDDGVGVFLLARARDEAGDAPGAAEAYRAFLAFSPPAGALEDERVAARLRLGLALLRSGDVEAARPELDASADRAGSAAMWIGLLEADALAQVGDTAGVRRAVEGHEDGIPGLRAWRARISAARQAGDASAARALANRARAWAGTDGTRAEFLVEAARAALAMGDTVPARDALLAAVERDAASRHARQAAELLQEGPMAPEDHLAVARVQVARGLHEESLDDYRAWLAAGGADSRRAAVTLEYATALFYSQRFEEVEEALRPMAGNTDARMLVARAAGVQGHAEEAARIYQELAHRSGTGTGRYALFLAADVLHDAGELDRARTLYAQVVRAAPGSDRAGLVTMRLAGIAFLEEDYGEAARIWEGYRSSYPRGTRADQSTYWAGRAHLALGDSATARARFREVRERDRESYYALLASRRLGEPFWPVPQDPSPASDPAAAARVDVWMRGVDMLAGAGFPDAASAHVDRVVAQAGGDRATRYALAEALIERGYGRHAIRIGIGLRGSGAPNRRLLRILYPFPYRTLIAEEARDRGFDPFISSALIRQESLYETRITSHVGARGLMQLMPATGREVARLEELERWDPEMLYHPEINVHLGTRLLADHLEEYDGSLPAVFGAYNAGPHRVERWREYPEWGDDELFTERIPFSETRDYVKILTRNRALYEGLYGDEGESR